MFANCDGEVGINVTRPSGAIRHVLSPFNRSGMVGLQLCLLHEG